MVFEIWLEIHVSNNETFENNSVSFLVSGVNIQTCFLSNFSVSLVYLTFIMRIPFGCLFPGDFFVFDTLFVECLAFVYYHWLKWHTSETMITDIKVFDTMHDRMVGHWNRRISIVPSVLSDFLEDYHLYEVNHWIKQMRIIFMPTAKKSSNRFKRSEI